MESLYKNETWELCQLPNGCHALMAKWIYKRNEGIHGLKMLDGKHRRCNPKKGIDFNKVFSPVIHHTSNRVFLAFVALFDLILE